MHLACLIYIAITFRDALQDDNSSNSVRNSLDELNVLLGRRKKSWMASRDELLNVMLSSDNGRIIHPGRTARMLEMLEMAKLLTRVSWDCVRDTLMELLRDERVERGESLCWDSGLFLEEVADRMLVFPVEKEDSILFSWIVNMML
jgi:hypothetical protein